MEILIDEAGSFAVNNAQKNSWCVVAAYACPDTEKRKYRKILSDLKRRENIIYSEEIKLHQISESNYLFFLEQLNNLNGILFCTATDSHFNSEEFVLNHKKNQALAIRKNIDAMTFESGKEAVRYLAEQLENLPSQLYIQLTCQILLIYSVVDRGISYLVQRTPHTLKNFRWRIDQKEPFKKIDFEDAFEKFCPTLLQSFTLKKPASALSWCDYRPMSAFMYKKGQLPTYLVDKFPHLKDEQGFDIQKIVSGDMKFIDSKSYHGIQIADLLASGLRKLLRQGFSDNTLIATYLGKLMVQEANKKPPIQLVAFGPEEKLDKNTADIIKIFIKYSRPMIYKG